MARPQIAVPKTVEYTFRTERKVPKLGLMLVGWGGNNGRSARAQPPQQQSENRPRAAGPHPRRRQLRAWRSGEHLSRAPLAGARRERIRARVATSSCEHPHGFTLLCVVASC